MRERTYLTDIFSVLNDKIGYVRLNEISPGLGDKAIRLLDLVVPLRSDITLSASINNTGLNSVTVQRVGATSRPIATIEKGKLIISDRQKRKVKINADFVNAVFSATEKTLQGEHVRGVSIRKRPIIYSPLWAVGEKKEFADIDVLSAANLFQYVVILGAPGSGKTTTAKAIASAHFGKFITDRYDNITDLIGLWSDNENLPIYIELKTMVADEQFPEISKQGPSVEFFKEYIQRALFSNNEQVMCYVMECLQNGKVVLVLDGLDEVPIPNTEEEAVEKRHGQLQRLIRSIRTVYPNIKIVVTSRPAGYSGWTLDGFEVIHIRPLSSSEAAGLAYAYYVAAGEDEKESEQLTKKLTLEIERLPDKIREYPLFICLLAALFREKKGAFPAKRGGLLQVSLETLLGTWTTRRHEGKTLQDLLNCTPDQIVKCLATISYRALAENGINGNTDTPDVPISMALEEFYYLGDCINPRQVLDYIMLQAGIWTSPAHGKLRFVHRLFQEYLAALAISDRDDKVEKMTNLVQENFILWHEVALLFADILSNKRNNGELLFLVERLIDVANEKDKTQFPKDAQTNTIQCQAKKTDIIALVAEIIIDEEFHTFGAIKKAQSYRACIENLKDSLNMQCLTGLQRRLIGQALDELGDPRNGVGLNKGIPEFCWERVPEGEFYMGTGEDEEDEIRKIATTGIWNIDREKPRHKLHIKEFYISRFPVTNEQFNSFILAEDGYSCDEWWSEPGLKWREKNSPPPTRLSLSKNMPQNCVSWYEAMAFCKWISYRTKSIIRLPSEAEWEYAARGGAAYQFVWGNSCDINYANVKDTGINEITSVGCFLSNVKGHKDIHLYDMNGGLWEWCSSIVEDDEGNKYSYPYNFNDGRENEDLDDHFFRATRGGYYGGEWMYARSCYRGRDIPSLRAERQGFRVVRDIE